MAGGRLKDDMAQMPMLEALQRQNAILQAVSYAAERFLGSEPIESVLSDVLEHLGKAAEVGSATALEFVNDPERGITLVPRHSWTTAGAESVFDYAPQGFSAPGTDYEPLLARLQSGNPLVARIGELPAGLQALLSSEVRSLAALPIFAEGELVGVIGLSQRWTEREWSDAELGALKTAATVIGAALERNYSRRAVRKRDELLRLFVDNAPVMVAYFDSRKRCRFANRRYAEFFGFPSQTLIGMSIEEIVGAAAYLAALPNMERCYAGRYVTFEQSQADSTGSVRHLEAQAVPHHSESGEVIGAYVTLTDVTERKKNEEGMRRVALENASILENTVSGIAFIKDRRIVRCNKSFAANFGYEPEELLGESTRLLHTSEERYLQQGRDVYSRIAAVGHATGIVQNRKKDGSLLWTHYSATALDRSDAAKGIIWVAQDITEHKNTEAALREAHDHLEEKVRERTGELAALNRELEAYSYSVSHDLRAPLRAIDGFAHLLEERLAGKLDQEAGEYLGKVRSSVRRMFRLIEALLELGRVSRKGMAALEVDLSACAREIAADIAGQDSTRQVEFAIEDGIRTVGDPQLLRLLLQNLFDNAWKYTSKTQAARIEFSTSTDTAGRRIYRVRDNGAGFDMTYAAKLFQPFQRLHSAHEFEGTGIGLATVARIARRHGGEVWAEGSVGQGATFKFSLAG
jgi:PAS domain S-box-containing protein